MGLFEKIKQLFSSLFGDEVISSTNGNITIWMPKIVKAVKTNTKTLYAIAERLRKATERVLARRKKNRKKAGDYVSPLDGGTVTVSESSYGLSGAGGNRAILEQYGSEEAKNAKE